MARGSKGTGRFFLILIIGALLGSLIGELVGALVPAGSGRDFFTRGIKIGTNVPFTLDLRVLTFTFGFTVKLNGLSLFGILLAIYAFRLY